ncbi:hypothetical protein OSB04_015603 [Centaurea solstitialis]|uniref:Uncharacterized protein n=1 Tax=Centaurea solstitialis TaxID=347529 RepID=A0AA38TJD3_9ASTR|nr:hypothetical protein OSB04_015603 [Centaurea solstitialis]
MPKIDILVKSTEVHELDEGDGGGGDVEEDGDRGDAEGQGDGGSSDARGNGGGREKGGARVAGSRQEGRRKEGGFRFHNRLTAAVDFNILKRCDFPDFKGDFFKISRV